VWLTNDDALRFDNSGRIDAPVWLGGGGAMAIDNSGTIATDGQSTALALSLQGGTAPATINLVNSGTITANLGISPVGLLLSSDHDASASITNAQTGTIHADGPFGVGVQAFSTALTLDNAGTISGSTAILSIGALANTIRNTGTITGAVLLGAGDDRVESSGTITGPVLLGEGDDVFVHRSGATLGQIVSGSEAMRSSLTRRATHRSTRPRSTASNS
jgi:hypothetical protein